MCVFCDTTLEAVLASLPAFVLRGEPRGVRGYIPGTRYVAAPGTLYVTCLDWASSDAHRVLTRSALVRAWTALTNELLYFSALARALKAVREGCTALPIAAEDETAVRDAAGQVAAERGRVHALVVALDDAEERAAPLEGLEEHSSALDEAFRYAHAPRPRSLAVVAIERTLTTYAFFTAPLALQLAPNQSDVLAHAPSGGAKIEACFDRVTVPPESAGAARAFAACPDSLAPVTRIPENGTQPPEYSSF